MIPLGVAAGHIKYLHDIEPLLRVPPDILSSVTLGSYTLNPRDGNPGNAFWTDRNPCPTTINSLGLPNPGIEKASEFLRDIATKLRAHGMSPRVSIAGFSPDEYRSMARALTKLGISEIELNLGCPNVLKEGKHERIASFVPELVREIVSEVFSVTGGPFAVKLSVFSDPFALEQMGRILADMDHAIRTVVLCNTFPNGSGFNDSGKLLINAANGFGGLAGLPLKHIALGHVRKMHEILPNSISIVGVGGICTGRDVYDMEQAGASSVQVGSAFFVNADPRVFSEIVTSYPGHEK